MTRRETWWVGAAWALIHIPLFALLVLAVDRAQDVRYYEEWARSLAGGHFPAHDPKWQYPPGAGALLWLPRLLGGDYAPAFNWLAFVADAAIMAMLLLGARRLGGGSAGPWVWVVALPLIGPVALYSRYDVLVTVFAVASALTMARRPALGGALAGLGAVVKIWPALLLFGAPPRRRGGTAALAAAIGAAGLTLLVFLLGASDSLSFLRAQGGRGVEIESIFATPFLVGRHLGWRGEVTFRYGSVEYVGTGVAAAGIAALLTTLLAIGWLAVWRWRRVRWQPATVADAALTATLLFIVVSRVISPQYMVWVLGLAGAALCVRGSSQRPVAVLLLVVTGLTQLEFPVVFEGIKAGQWLPSAVLLLRNVLLVTTTVVSMRRLWRSTVPGRRGYAGGDDAAGEPPGDARSDVLPARWS